jgi:hypothetical protein
MLTSASLKVAERKVLARSTDTKPYSTYGVDERIGLLAVDLAANAPYIHVDNVGAGIKMQIPNLLQQHRTWHDMALVAN